MRTSWLVAVLAVCLMVGCNSVSYNFPNEISSVAHGCKNDAKAKIESKGTSIKEKYSCKVILVPGTQQFEGRWCWYDTLSKMWVGGTCNALGNIRIGCNPNNRADIHVPSLTHEFGHHWLMSNYSNMTHDPKYDDVFDNWQHAREVTGSSILRDADGVLTHVDAVKIKVK